MSGENRKRVNRTGIRGLSTCDKRNLAILIGIGIVAIVLLIVVVVLLGEKAGGDEVPQTELAEIEEDVAEPDLPVPEGKMSPLTGTYIKESWAKKRPIALMIENTTMALPQYGLNSCGIIYECPVEGGITRLMGISDSYHKLDQFGNIRSCRPYYVYLASEYNAIYCHVGQSVHGQEVLNTGIVDDLNAMDGAISNAVFYRTSDKKAPHNCFTKGKMIDEGIEIKGFKKSYKEDPGTHFMYSDEDEYHDPEDPAYVKNSADEGKECAVVKPYFINNHPYFVYNKDAGTYDRYQFGDRQIDALDDEPVSVKNIILYTTAGESSLYAGTDYLNLPLVGEGKGKYVCNGKMIDITWEKDGDTKPTKFYDTDGDELVLAPGNTWICLCELQRYKNNEYYETVAAFDSRDEQ
ncbi:MAG: DUF3048 domain-containing protein [Lachnospiraceae bacterium]|nr:DUF3048 domain-containing protein [Lachnospiraceae bacterium]